MGAVGGVGKMVEITRTYHNTKFSAKVVKDAVEKFQMTFVTNEKQSRVSSASVELGFYSYSFDDTEHCIPDFLEYYRQDVKGALLILYGNENTNSLRLSYDRFKDTSTTRVTARCSDRAHTLSLLNVFEDCHQEHLETFSSSSDGAPRVFIGHGRSQAWRDLKDHLTDQHGLAVTAYETGARAGHTIRDILDDMTMNTNIAFLVLTAEDEMAGGKFQARPNVIHETGLFQGKLGFSRAIVLLEDGCEEFSNLAGIQQLRFSKGKIRETFGDVLATIKREFP